MNQTIQNEAKQVLINAGASYVNFIEDKEGTQIQTDLPVEHEALQDAYRILSGDHINDAISKDDITNLKISLEDPDSFWGNL